MKQAGKRGENKLHCYYFGEGWLTIPHFQCLRVVPKPKSLLAFERLTGHCASFLPEALLCPLLLSGSFCTYLFPQFLYYLGARIKLFKIFFIPY